MIDDLFMMLIFIYLLFSVEELRPRVRLLLHTKIGIIWWNWSNLRSLVLNPFQKGLNHWWNLVDVYPSHLPSAYASMKQVFGSLNMKRQCLMEQNSIKWMYLLGLWRQKKIFKRLWTSSQAELNRWPSELQSLALPLSYGCLRRGGGRCKMSIKLLKQFHFQSAFFFIVLILWFFLFCWFFFDFACPIKDTW